MAVWEILLNSFFQVLFDKLASLGLDYALREGIGTTLLSKCKRVLVTINALPDDSKDNQLNDGSQGQLWPDDTKELANDLEDLLDEFVIEAAQAKSEVEHITSRGQVKRKFSFFGQGESSKTNPNPHSFVSETREQELKDRLEEIVTRKTCLSSTDNNATGSNATGRRLPSTSLPERRLFGREKEEAELVELLTREPENGDATVSIVPIVGMGGVGKTSLAQRLYNDAKVSKCFEKKSWVCVSDDFDVLNITKTILQSVIKSSCEDKNLDELQVKLKGSLSGKKFLLVLDDVWNEKYSEWTFLLKPLEAGAKGSKIIVTTRSLHVVSITGSSPYYLKELSLGDCASLFAFHALGATNFERHPDLERIGKKIAEKCNGLPLAAKILGNLLRNKKDPDEWEAILKVPCIGSSAENDELLPSLN